MKDNGFTLVELLAVITILALLAIASMEAMDVSTRKNKEHAEEVQRSSILNSAIAYVPTSQVPLPDVVSEDGCQTITYPGSDARNNICEVRLSLSFLHEEGVLEDRIKNPRLDQYYDMDASYVYIVYVTPSMKEKYQDQHGEYDGVYYYRLYEVFEEEK